MAPLKSSLPLDFYWQQWFDRGDLPHIPAGAHRPVAEAATEACRTWMDDSKVGLWWHAARTRRGELVQHGSARGAASAATVPPAGPAGVLGPGLRPLHPWLHLAQLGAQGCHVQRAEGKQLEEGIWWAISCTTQVHAQNPRTSNCQAATFARVVARQLHLSLLNRALPSLEDLVSLPPLTIPHCQVLAELFKNGAADGDFGQPPVLPTQYSRICMASSRAGTGACSRVKPGSYRIHVLGFRPPGLARCDHVTGKTSFVKAHITPKHEVTVWGTVGHR